MFSQYYMQKAAVEFADDLDRIRSADDFRDGFLSLLVHALQQGVNVFSMTEKQRVICWRRDGR
jgi:ribosome assembly protein 3